MQRKINPKMYSACLPALLAGRGNNVDIERSDSNCVVANNLFGSPGGFAHCTLWLI